jgi:hypothetical protein
MYPGTNNTELCPTRFFSDGPVYLHGEVPGDAEIADRLDRYWRPYHEALTAGQYAQFLATLSHSLLRTPVIQNHLSSRSSSRDCPSTPFTESRDFQGREIPHCEP